jgi:hypothetical protein
MPTTASDMMHWRRPPAKEGRKAAVVATQKRPSIRTDCGALWAKSTRSIWEYKKSFQRQCTKPIYIGHETTKAYDLSDIYHNVLQDDKRQDRIHESPPARMSQNSAIAQEEDLQPGRRPTTAHRRGRPAYLGLSCST